MDRRGYDNITPIQKDMNHMKKKIIAILAAIAALFGMGFATNTALADDYPPTVTVSGTTATVSWPAGTFEPNEAVTVTYDDDIVADVVAIAQKTKTVNAKADGSLTLRYIFKEGQAGKTVTAIVTRANGEQLTADITVPSAGTSAGNDGTITNGTAGTTADTGMAVAPYGVAVVLLVAAGLALFAVRKSAARR